MSEQSPAQSVPVAATPATKSATKVSVWRPATWPLAMKIGRDLLLAALLPMALAFWLTSSRATQAVEDTAKTNLELVAGQTAARLDQLVIDTRRASYQLAADPAVARLCRLAATLQPEAKTRDLPGAAAPVFAQAMAEVQLELDTLNEVNPDVASCFVANATGIGIASTSDKNVGQDLRFRDYMQTALAGDAYVSRLLIGKTSGRPGVYMSTPVRDDAGDVLGVVVVKLRGESVWELVTDLLVGESGYAMLVNDWGVILAHPVPTLRFRTLDEIPQAQQDEIDPERRYGVTPLVSLDYGELSVAAGAETLGTAELSMEPLGEIEPQRVPFVAGFAPLSSRPWTVVAMQPRSEFVAPIDDLRRRQWIVLIGVAALAGAVAVWRARSITRPAKAVTEAATRIAGGDLTARAPHFSDDEIGRLADAFNDMIPKLESHVDMQRSIATAEQVQKSLLPGKDPTLPRLEVAGRSEYCDETGGDYYDFLETAQLGPTSSLLALADVMGHGVAAALLMSAVRAALRSHGTEAMSLGTLLTKINQACSQDAMMRRFVTMSIVVVDPEAGTVRYGSAGHDPVLLYRPSTGDFHELEGGGMPLGLIDDADYEEYVFDDLQPGDILLLGTDGIWEAQRNPDAVKADGADVEEFGKQRMQEVIRANADGPVSDMADALEQAITDFLAGTPPQDDVTFVMAKVQ